MDRAKGMRLAPTIAARRGSERDGEAEVTIPPGLGVRYCCGTDGSRGVRGALAAAVTFAVGPELPESIRYRR
ncbi:hypothetical protein GCM10023200_08210 [Actinomycetospora chlora]|uniref:Uncharacterized protein n=1 Tax=Actinomycetospora chlora TaxID=663608 RepID=A0ABP9ACP3_9PSEU